MRNIYEPHKQTTTTEHQIPDLGQMQPIAVGLNVLMVPNLLPFLKQQYNITTQKHTTKYQLEGLTQSKKSIYDRSFHVKVRPSKSVTHITVKSLFCLKLMSKTSNTRSWMVSINFYFTPSLHTNNLSLEQFVKIFNQLTSLWEKNSYSNLINCFSYCYIYMRYHKGYW